MKNKILLGALLLMAATAVQAIDIKSKISIKQPGNAAVSYDLDKVAQSQLPITVTANERQDGDDVVYTVTILA